MHTPQLQRQASSEYRTYEQVVQVQDGPHLQLALPHPDMMTLEAKTKEKQNKT